MSRRNRRKQDFHGGSEHARRSAVGAATQFHHELNHGETGKCDPLWGGNPALLVRPIHEGFGGHFMEVWANSWRFGFMEVLELGAPETAPPPGQAHTHSHPTI